MIGKVEFQDGTAATMLIEVYAGACLVGQPTAYVQRNGQTVWVKRKYPDCPLKSSKFLWVEVPE